jgi:nucleotidyltransferase/DNA polymerase involved in DNA repair
VANVLLPNGASKRVSSLVTECHIFMHTLEVPKLSLQVEQQRNLSLYGKAIAIQQHGDIIAANASAKGAGVRKHCPPDEARKLLHAVGGKVVHVHVEDGHRISYRPYREASARFHRLLGSVAAEEDSTLVVEKASIDEAFILQPCAQAHAGARDHVTNVHPSMMLAQVRHADAGASASWYS